MSLQSKGLSRVFSCTTTRNHQFFGAQPYGPTFTPVKNLPVSAGDMGLIPGLERSSGEGNGNSLQYSCLENSRDRGAWLGTVHEVRHD